MWAAEPFVGGAYSSIMPMGGWTEYGPSLASPVGRIYWAGTETSARWPGFYEGAVQAAQNAVNFVKKDVSPTGKYESSPMPSPGAPAGSPAASTAVAAASMYSLWVAAFVAMLGIFN